MTKSWSWVSCLVAVIFISGTSLNADAGVIELAVATVVSDKHLAGSDSDPHHQRLQQVAPLFVHGGKRVSTGDRRRARGHFVLGATADWGVEERENAVTDELVHKRTVCNQD